MTLHLLELVVANAPCGIGVIDETGAIVLANPTLHRMFGYEPDRLVGLAFALLVPEDARGAHAPHDERFRQPPTTQSLSFRMVEARRADGTTCFVEVNLTPTMREGRPVVVAAVVDCTGRHDLQVQLLDRQAFERALADVAVGFLTLPDDRLDDHIIASQGQLAEQLGAQRSTLWLHDAAGDLRYTHMWVSGRSLLPTPDGLSAGTALPWTTARLRDGHLVMFQSVDDLPDATDRETHRRLGTKSAVVLPLHDDGGLIGALTFATITEERTWDASVIEHLQLVGPVLATALARRTDRLALQAARTEVRRLRALPAHQSVTRARDLRPAAGPRVLAASSPAARAALSQIEQVAPTSATVLLLGETGAGKEIFAETLHQLSPRRQSRMVRVNCAAIPSALIESELFGRERGAYTGAISRQAGRFELADRSTIFLDEVGELPLDVQGKLLRVLQDMVIERLGSPHPIKVDVRVIAATNRDLEQAVADRTFREDLYYRLQVFPIRVPALRERVEDIEVLAWSFIREFAAAFGKRIESLSAESLRALQAYPWPGNVRELRNVVERAVIVSHGPQLVIQPPQPLLRPATARRLKLVDVETDHLRAVLESTGWRVRGVGGAADLLGIEVRLLESRMLALGIQRPDRPGRGADPRRAPAPDVERPGHDS